LGHHGATFGEKTIDKYVKVLFIRGFGGVRMGPRLAQKQK